MRDYTKYDIWKDGIKIFVDIYELTKLFPEEEKFGIISQLRKASVSIASNFAEGCSRLSEKEFKRFTEFSLGSAFELKTQLIISDNLGYISKDNLATLMELIDKCSKQMNSLRNKLK
ncbi:MAG: four helix bundle protein [Ekhidna sp.]